MWIFLYDTGLSLSETAQKKQSQSWIFAINRLRLYTTHIYVLRCQTKMLANVNKGT